MDVQLGAANDGLVPAVRKRQFPVIGAGGGISSFIHLDDAAAATVLALDHGGAGLYNVTDDGKKIALFADGVASFPDGLPIGELRENVTLTTAEPGYEWVNPLQIWAVGTCDVTTGDVEIAGYAV